MKPCLLLKFNPSFEAQLTTGDTLIVVGEPTNLNRLRKALNPEVRHETRRTD